MPPINSRSELAAAVNSILDAELRPALGAHAGSINLKEIDGEVVRLEMVASCSRCYFRRGCAENLVQPTLRDALGSHLSYVVDNARTTDG